MKNTLWRNAIVAVALIATVGMATPQPARADTASTTRTILYAVGAIAAIATIANVSHKNAVASTVQGYLPDGSTVYADGRVVARNGQTWYPGNQGLAVACAGQSCQITNNGSYNGGNVGYANGGYYGNTGGYYAANTGSGRHRHSH